MFTEIFNAALRSIALPIVAILVLSNTFLGLKNTFLVVVIALTFTNILSILWQVIRILPNLVLLKGRKIIGLVIRIIIEISSMICFWVYFFSYIK